MKAYLVFGKMLTLLWLVLHSIGLFFIVANGQILDKLSRHLVTVTSAHAQTHSRSQLSLFFSLSQVNSLALLSTPSNNIFMCFCLAQPPPPNVIFIDVYSRIQCFKSQLQLRLGRSENTHRRGKDRCMAGHQFN